VNDAFLNKVIEVVRPGDVVWVHDYQLMLLPRLLRQRLPEAAIGFFLHIPFPSFEMFRLLPWRKQILEGLLAADLVGFHTSDYAWHFLDSVHRLLGYEAIMGQITTSDHMMKVDVFPMGIDYKRYSSVVQGSKARAEMSRFRKKLGDRTMILSIDRLDYTKGTPQRLWAFDAFLEKHPEYHERLVLVQVVVPSRTEVKDYALLKKQIDEIVGAINGRHGTIGWTPVWYLYRSLPFHSLAALYSIADVALVTPIRDGMNLIAKEYIATKRDGRGVLIASETAGVARELGEAIIVNVNNQEEIVQALEKALAMPDEEQIERNRTMQKRLQRYSLVRWADEFIGRLLHTKELQRETETRALARAPRMELVSDFQRSKQRLIFLDYDGTLIPFSERPQEAKPGEELVGLLSQLAKSPENELVLISGRDKYTLEKWFGDLHIGLVAEHGAWIKEKGGDWETIEPLRNNWKEEVRPILELYVDRTPGSLIEEKEFSLVWHHRKADSALGALRARELVSDLQKLTANLNLQVLEGSKVVEVKNAGIDKGRAALRWISSEDWDFILAIGDDWTDEDVFRVLPATAWSIKVGFAASAAKYNLSSPSQVRYLLTEMAEGPNP